MKRQYESLLIAVLMALLVLFAGCSGESPPEDASTAGSRPAAESELLTVQDTVAYNLNEVMTRLRYTDKSGLYENEFEYFRKETNYDDYLKRRRVDVAEADTLSHLEIVDVVLYDHDSADAILYIHFEGPSGVHHELKDTLTVYYHNGRWIKPTESNIDDQLKYERAMSEEGSQSSE